MAGQQNKNGQPRLVPRGTHQICDRVHYVDVVRQKHFGHRCNLPRLRFQSCAERRMSREDSFITAHAPAILYRQVRKSSRDSDISCHERIMSATRGYEARTRGIRCVSPPDEDRVRFFVFVEVPREAHIANGCLPRHSQTIMLWNWELSQRIEQVSGFSAVSVVSAACLYVLSQDFPKNPFPPSRLHAYEVTCSANSTLPNGADT